jgi:hypothetical protein
LAPGIPQKQRTRQKQPCVQLCYAVLCLILKEFPFTQIVVMEKEAWKFKPVIIFSKL